MTKLFITAIDSNRYILIVYISKLKYFLVHSGVLNFKNSMAILYLALSNYLLDIVSPGGSIVFGVGEKILGFGVPR